jgi:hypothetical protein
MPYLLLSTSSSVAVLAPRFAVPITSPSAPACVGLRAGTSRKRWRPRCCSNRLASAGQSNGSLFLPLPRRRAFSLAFEASDFLAPGAVDGRLVRSFGAASRSASIAAPAPIQENRENSGCSSLLWMGSRFGAFHRFQPWSNGRVLIGKPIRRSQSSVERTRIGTRSALREARKPPPKVLSRVTLQRSAIS